jgi:hypothetical protein
MTESVYERDAASDYQEKFDRKAAEPPNPLSSKGLDPSREHDTRNSRLIASGFDAFPSPTAEADRSALKRMLFRRSDPSIGNQQLEWECPSTFLTDFSSEYSQILRRAAQEYLENESRTQSKSMTIEILIILDRGILLKPLFHE